MKNVLITLVLGANIIVLLPILIYMMTPPKSELTIELERTRESLGGVRNSMQRLADKYPPEQ